MEAGQVDPEVPAHPAPRPPDLWVLKRTVTFVIPSSHSGVSGVRKADVETCHASLTDEARSSPLLEGCACVKPLRSEAPARGALGALTHGLSARSKASSVTVATFYSFSCECEVRHGGNRANKRFVYRHELVKGMSCIAHVGRLACMVDATAHAVTAAILFCRFDDMETCGGCQGTR
jgi:hypothetical protein